MILLSLIVTIVPWKTNGSLSYDNSTRCQQSEEEYLTCGLVSVPDSLHVVLVCV
jgi:hypothetical protein